jgi:hypothetical protein
MEDDEAFPDFPVVCITDDGGICSRFDYVADNLSILWINNETNSVIFDPPGQQASAGDLTSITPFNDPSGPGNEAIPVPTVPPGEFDRLLISLPSSERRAAFPPPSEVAEAPTLLLFVMGVATMFAGLAGFGRRPAGNNADDHRGEDRNSASERSATRTERRLYRMAAPRLAASTPMRWKQSCR